MAAWGQAGAGATGENRPDLARGVVNHNVPRRAVDLLVLRVHVGEGGLVLLQKKEGEAGRGSERAVGKGQNAPVRDVCVRGTSSLKSLVVKRDTMPVFPTPP